MPCAEIARKKPVNISAGHAAIGGDRAVHPSIREAQQGPSAVGTGRLADMHLIAGERRAVRHAFAHDLAQRLVAFEHRLDGEKT